MRSKRSIDITNQKFNMLTAVRYEYSKGGKEYWLFHCDCGSDKIMQKGNVTHGGRISCGCAIKKQFQKAMCDVTNWSRSSVGLKMKSAEPNAKPRDFPIPTMSKKQTRNFVKRRKSSVISSIRSMLKRANSSSNVITVVRRFIPAKMLTFSLKVV